MSYCRWSSDNLKSDVYVYEDVTGGWTTHVAGRRPLGLDTLPQSPYDSGLMQRLTNEAWQEIYSNYHKRLQELEFEDIDLPEAGGTFNDASPGECADRLERLKAVGFHVPEGVIETLREEQSEMDAGTDHQ